MKRQTGSRTIASGSPNDPTETRKRCGDETSMRWGTEKKIRFQGEKDCLEGGKNRIYSVNPGQRMIGGRGAQLQLRGQERVTVASWEKRRLTRESIEATLG